MDGYPLCWQDFFDDMGPLHDYNGCRVIKDFGELVLHNTWFLQTVKIKVVERELAGLVLLAERKARATHSILAAQAAR